MNKFNKMALLEIKNLHATVAGREILRGIDLTVKAGEVHAIMGPNGSGKSTLAQVLAGRDIYHVTEGSVTYDGKDLLELSPDKRARLGIFLAFQYPEMSTATIVGPEAAGRYLRFTIQRSIGSKG